MGTILGYPNLGKLPYVQVGVSSLRISGYWRRQASELSARSLLRLYITVSDGRVKTTMARDALQSKKVETTYDPHDPYVHAGDLTQLHVHLYVSWEQVEINGMQVLQGQPVRCRLCQVMQHADVPFWPAA